jgi:DNA-binding transcriptional ArsR family regulator
MFLCPVTTGAISFASTSSGQNQFGDRASRRRRLLNAANRARALADPTRLTLAAALESVEELCVCDLAWIAERSQNLVSHHLGALRGAGLVESRRDGKMVLYGLTPAGRALLASVVPEAVQAPRGHAN